MSPYPWRSAIRRSRFSLTFSSGSIVSPYAGGDARKYARGDAGESNEREAAKFNSGTETLEIKPGQFSMKDSSDAEVKTFGKRRAYNMLDMSPLAPNYGTTTAFICAADPGSTGFVFTFTHEVDGQKTPLEVSVR